ncbi:hypothetical protein MKW98_015386 [Papaver atlanticum]|uniref:Uncharacterized protein n=1 Tax=Papaver atlanticum TaxID=357466 RepID=A0AAD4X4U6_9MAGN|nr:hypothetical protein MKW98_015386 [Papaver atlanticum]
MALGVSKLTQMLPKEPIELNAPGGLATVVKDGKTETNLPDGKVKRGGIVGLTAVNGLARVNDGGGVGVNLKKGEITQGPKYEHVEIANGVASVKRSSEAKVDLEKGQVTTGAKAEGEIPGVANVNAGASIGVNVKNGKVTKDVSGVKRSNGNYK